MDKGTPFAIEWVRRKGNGNAKAVIKGIGVVTCAYANSALDQFWLIDARIHYRPGERCKSKLDHMREILNNFVHQKVLPFYVVLMDTWHATKDLWLCLPSLDQTQRIGCANRAGHLSMKYGLLTAYLTSAAQESAPK